MSKQLKIAFCALFFFIVTVFILLIAYDKGLRRAIKTLDYIPVESNNVDVEDTNTLYFEVLDQEKSG